MLSPDGQSGDIPVANVQAALQAGFKQAVPMKAPTGEVGYIPNERMADAMKAGFIPHQLAPTPNPMPAAQATGTAMGIPLPHVQLLQDAIKQVGDTKVGKGLNAISDWFSKPTTQMALSQVGVPDISAVENTAETVGKGVQAVNELRPSAGVAKAVANFKNVEGAVGEHTVAMTDALGKSLSDIKEGIDTGLNAPSVINKFVTRIADTDQPPLTYSEARQFYSNMGDLAASDKMAANTKMQRLINNVRGALGDAISTTADQGGKLQQYRDAMKGYEGAMGTKAKLEVAKSAAMKVGGAALLGSAGYAGYKTINDIIGAK